MQALRANNITRTTQLMSLFLQGWEMNAPDINSNWYFRMHVRDCDNPSIWDVLNTGPTETYKITFMFIKPRTGRPNKKIRVDVFEYPAGFVQSLVVAYLNSLFPTAIDYPYTTSSLNDRLNMAVDSSVKTVLARLNRVRPKPKKIDIYKPFIQMKSEIETWS